MSQSDMFGNIAYEPNFLEPTQNALGSGTKTKVSTPENLVEPLVLASTDSPMNVPKSLGQQTQSVHSLPAVSQEKAMLLQELEALRQRLQHQQTLIKSLTEQLVSSQEQIAQMERDLALLQQNYDEQRHLLKNAEANHQDLRTRLYRQQRQALQYKAALERCLENSTLNTFDFAVPKQAFQNQLDLDQAYYTTVSQPLEGLPSDCSSSQGVSPTSPKISEVADSSLSLDCVSRDVEVLALSTDMKHEASPEETHPQETAYLDTTAIDSTQTTPLMPPQGETQQATPSAFAFQGQPVQPWSASQSPHASSTTMRLEQSNATTVQAVAVKASRPNQTASPHLTRSSPLPERLRPASRRKPPVRIELPTFPRR